MDYRSKYRRFSRNNAPFPPTPLQRYLATPGYKATYKSQWYHTTPQAGYHTAPQTGYRVAYVNGQRVKLYTSPWQSVSESADSRLQLIGKRNHLILITPRRHHGHGGGDVSPGARRAPPESPPSQGYYSSLSSPTSPFVERLVVPARSFSYQDIYQSSRSPLASGRFGFGLGTRRTYSASDVMTSASMFDRYYDYIPCTPSYRLWSSNCDISCAYDDYSSADNLFRFRKAGSCDVLCPRSPSHFDFRPFSPFSRFDSGILGYEFRSRSGSGSIIRSSRSHVDYHEFRTHTRSECDFPVRYHGPSSKSECGGSPNDIATRSESGFSVTLSDLDNSFQDDETCSVSSADRSMDRSMDSLGVFPLTDTDFDRCETDSVHDRTLDIVYEDDNSDPDQDNGGSTKTTTGHASASKNLLGAFEQSLVDQHSRKSVGDDDVFRQHTDTMYISHGPDDHVDDYSEASGYTAASGGEGIGGGGEDDACGQHTDILILSGSPDIHFPENSMDLTNNHDGSHIADIPLGHPLYSGEHRSSRRPDHDEDRFMQHTDVLYISDGGNVQQQDTSDHDFTQSDHPSVPRSRDETGQGFHNGAVHPEHYQQGMTSDADGEDYKFTRETIYITDGENVQIYDHFLDGQDSEVPSGGVPSTDGEEYRHHTQTLYISDGGNIHHDGEVLPTDGEEYRHHTQTLYISDGGNTHQDGEVTDEVLPTDGEEYRHHTQTLYISDEGNIHQDSEVPGEVLPTDGEEYRHHIQTLYISDGGNIHQDGEVTGEVLPTYGDGEDTLVAMDTGDPREDDEADPREDDEESDSGSEGDESDTRTEHRHIQYISEIEDSGTHMEHRPIKYISEFEDSYTHIEHRPINYISEFEDSDTHIEHRPIKYSSEFEDSDTHIEHRPINYISEFEDSDTHVEHRPIKYSSEFEDSDTHIEHRPIKYISEFEDSDTHIEHRPINYISEFEDSDTHIESDTHEEHRPIVYISESDDKHGNIQQTLSADSNQIHRQLRQESARTEQIPTSQNYSEDDHDFREISAIEQSEEFEIIEMPEAPDSTMSSSPIPQTSDSLHSISKYVSAEYEIADRESLVEFLDEREITTSSQVHLAAEDSDGDFTRGQRSLGAFGDNLSETDEDDDNVVHRSLIQNDNLTLDKTVVLEDNGHVESLSENNDNFVSRDNATGDHTRSAVVSSDKSQSGTDSRTLYTDQSFATVGIVSAVAEDMDLSETGGNVHSSVQSQAVTGEVGLGRYTSQQVYYEGPSKSLESQKTVNSETRPTESTLDTAAGIVFDQFNIGTRRDNEQEGLTDEKYPDCFESPRRRPDSQLDIRTWKTDDRSEDVGELASADAKTSETKTSPVRMNSDRGNGMEDVNKTGNKHNDGENKAGTAIEVGGKISEDAWEGKASDSSYTVVTRVAKTELGRGGTITHVADSRLQVDSRRPTEDVSIDAGLGEIGNPEELLETENRDCGQRPEAGLADSGSSVDNRDESVYYGVVNNRGGSVDEIEIDKNRSSGERSAEQRLENTNSRGVTCVSVCEGGKTVDVFNIDGHVGSESGTSSPQIAIQIDNRNSRRPEDPEKSEELFTSMSEDKHGNKVTEEAFPGESTAVGRYHSHRDEPVEKGIATQGNRNERDLCQSVLPTATVTTTTNTEEEFAGNVNQSDVSVLRPSDLNNADPGVGEPRRPGGRYVDDLLNATAGFLDNGTAGNNEGSNLTRIGESVDESLSWGTGDTLGDTQGRKPGYVASGSQVSYASVKQTSASLKQTQELSEIDRANFTDQQDLSELARENMTDQQNLSEIDGGNMTGKENLSEMDELRYTDRTEAKLPQEKKAIILTKVQYKVKKMTKTVTRTNVDVKKVHKHFTGDSLEHEHLTKVEQMTVVSQKTWSSTESLDEPVEENVKVSYQATFDATRDKDGHELPSSHFETTYETVLPTDFIRTPALTVETEDILDITGPVPEKMSPSQDSYTGSEERINMGRSRVMESIDIGNTSGIEDSEIELKLSEFEGASEISDESVFAVGSENVTVLSNGKEMLRNNSSDPNQDTRVKTAVKKRSKLKKNVPKDSKTVSTNTEAPDEVDSSRNPQPAYTDRIEIFSNAKSPRTVKKIRWTTERNFTDDKLICTFYEDAVNIRPEEDNAIYILEDNIHVPDKSMDRLEEFVTLPCRTSFKMLVHFPVKKPIWTYDLASLRVVNRDESNQTENSSESGSKTRDEFHQTENLGESGSKTRDEIHQTENLGESGSETRDEIHQTENLSESRNITSRRDMAIKPDRVVSPDHPSVSETVNTTNQRECSGTVTENVDILNTPTNNTEIINPMHNRSEIATHKFIHDFAVIKQPAVTRTSDTFDGTPSNARTEKQDSGNDFSVGSLPSTNDSKQKHRTDDSSAESRRAETDTVDMVTAAEHPESYHTDWGEGERDYDADIFLGGGSNELGNNDVNAVDKVSDSSENRDQTDEILLKSDEISRTSEMSPRSAVKTRIQSGGEMQVVGEMQTEVSRSDVDARLSDKDDIPGGKLVATDVRIHSADRLRDLSEPSETVLEYRYPQHYPEAVGNLQEQDNEQNASVRDRNWDVLHRADTLPATVTAGLSDSVKYRPGDLTAYRANTSARAHVLTTDTLTGTRILTSHPCEVPKFISPSGRPHTVGINEEDTVLIRDETSGLRTVRNKSGATRSEDRPCTTESEDAGEEDRVYESRAGIELATDTGAVRVFTSSPRGDTTTTQVYGSGVIATHSVIETGGNIDPHCVKVPYTLRQSIDSADDRSAHTDRGEVGKLNAETNVESDVCSKSITADDGMLITEPRLLDNGSGDIKYANVFSASSDGHKYPTKGSVGIVKVAGTIVGSVSEPCAVERPVTVTRDLNESAEVSIQSEDEPLDHDRDSKIEEFSQAFRKYSAEELPLRERKSSDDSKSVLRDKPTSVKPTSVNTEANVRIKQPAEMSQFDYDDWSHSQSAQEQIRINRSTEDGLKFIEEISQSSGSISFRLEEASSPDDVNRSMCSDQLDRLDWLESQVSNDSFDQWSENRHTTHRVLVTGQMDYNSDAEENNNNFAKESDSSFIDSDGADLDTSRHSTYSTTVTGQLRENETPMSPMSGDGRTSREHMFGELKEEWPDMKSRMLSSASSDGYFSSANEQMSSEFRHNVTFDTIRSFSSTSSDGYQSFASDHMTGELRHHPPYESHIHPTSPEQQEIEDIDEDLKATIREFENWSVQLSAEDRQNIEQAKSFTSVDQQVNVISPDIDARMSGQFYSSSAENVRGRNTLRPKSFPTTEDSNVRTSRNLAKVKTGKYTSTSESAVERKLGKLTLISENSSGQVIDRLPRSKTEISVKSHSERDDQWTHDGQTSGLDRQTHNRSNEDSDVGVIHLGRSSTISSYQPGTSTLVRSQHVTRTETRTSSENVRHTSHSVTDTSSDVTDRSSDHVTRASSDRVTNRLGDHVTNRSSDNVIRTSSGHVTSISSDHVTNRSRDHVTNRSSDNVIRTSRDHLSTISSDHVTRPSSDHATYKSSERVIHKSDNIVTNRSSEHVTRTFTDQATLNVQKLKPFVTSSASPSNGTSRSSPSAAGGESNSKTKTVASFERETYENVPPAIREEVREDLLHHAHGYFASSVSVTLSRTWKEFEKLWHSVDDSSWSGVLYPFMYTFVFQKSVGGDGERSQADRMSQFERLYPLLLIEDVERCQNHVCSSLYGEEYRTQRKAQRYFLRGFTKDIPSLWRTKRRQSLMPLCEIPEERIVSFDNSDSVLLPTCHSTTIHPSLVSFRSVSKTQFHRFASEGDGIDSRSGSGAGDNSMDVRGDNSDHTLQYICQGDVSDPTIMLSKRLRDLGKDEKDVDILDDVLLRGLRHYHRKFIRLHQSVKGEVRKVKVRRQLFPSRTETIYEEEEDEKCVN